MNIFKKKVDNSDKKLKQLILDLHSNRFELAKEKKILNTFLDDGIVSLVDMDTNEILFLNKNGKEEFGEDAINKKCYKVLHDSNKVCAFCNGIEVRQKEGKLLTTVIKDDKGRICFVKTAYIKVVNGLERHLRLDKKTVIDSCIPEIVKLIEE